MQRSLRALATAMLLMGLGPGVVLAASVEDLIVQVDETLGNDDDFIASASTQLERMPRLTDRKRPLFIQQKIQRTLREYISGCNRLIDHGRSHIDASSKRVAELDSWLTADHNGPTTSSTAAQQKKTQLLEKMEELESKIHELESAMVESEKRLQLETKRAEHEPRAPK